MIWDRAQTIGLAKESCTSCFGIGLTGLRRVEPEPCNCVLRAIFRACYARFRYYAIKERFISTVRLTSVQGRERKKTFGRPVEEYLADFCLVSKRVLSEDEYRVFRCRYLMG